MKWKKVGKQRYESVSLTGRTYVVEKVSMYLWQLTTDGVQIATSTTANSLKNKAILDDEALQKEWLR